MIQNQEHRTEDKYQQHSVEILIQRTRQKLQKLLNYAPNAEAQSKPSRQIIQNKGKEHSQSQRTQITQKKIQHRKYQERRKSP